MQKPDSRKSGVLLRRATVAARAFLAVTLLLTLVGGSITWRATASEQICTMACCAGKAPHAAGSCMHGACEISDSIDVNRDSQHHHEQPAPTSDSENDDLLAGVTAGVCGAGMGNVPTIEATTDQAAPDKSASVAARKTERINSAISPAVMSPPCEPGCGACTSGFAASNRSRNMVALARLKSALPQSSGKLAYASRPLMRAACLYSSLTVPRGPPLSFS